MMPSTMGLLSPFAAPPFLHAMVCCGSKWHQPPLHYATQNVRIRATAMLVAAVPTAVLIRDGYGATAAHICMKRPSMEVILPILLDACPAVAAVKDEYGEYPLHASCCSELQGVEQQAVLRRLYDAFPDALRLRNNLGHTPLHLASMGSYPVVLGLLLAWRPDGVKILDYSGHAPIHFAIRYRRFDAIQALFNACPESLWIAGPTTGDTPMHVAAQFLFDRDIEAYLLRIIDPEILTFNNALGETPLHVAVAGGRTEMVRQWTTVNPKAIQRLTPTGDTVFHLAARKSHHETFQLLFELWPEGASQANHAGVLPLDVRARQGIYDGLTILHVAARENEVKMITTFVSAFPDRMMSMTRQGHTVLEVAVKYDAYDVVACLRTRMPECWLHQKPNGFTALHTFVAFGQPRKVSSLLNDIDDKRRLELMVLRGANGDTLVHTAMRHHKLDVLKLLLVKWPSVVLVENTNNETPFDVACDFCDFRVLFQYGSARKCPVPGDSERASCTVQRRTKVDAVGVLIDMTSTIEQRKAAVELLRAPWLPSERPFAISKRMWQKIIHAAQRQPDAAAHHRWWCHLAQ